MKAFVIDVSRCNGCHNCQIACKDEHCGNDWTPYAASQPDTGHFWMRVDGIEHGQVPKVIIEYRPIMCNHCRDAACVEAGDGCVYRRNDGLVIIDPLKSKGRKDLIEACPYGRIYWNDALGIPQKCTGCAHLVDQGGVPHCVDLCATGALRFGEEEDLADDIARATCLAGVEHGVRVHYLNLLGLFIGGEVWDPQDDEIIKDALIELSDDSGLIASTSSDHFGDFWFRGLGAGRYVLDIKADGYKPVRKEIELGESLNVGDFALQRS